MKVIIAATKTKTCAYRKNLEKQLQDAGLEYEVMYFEDHPELIDRYKIKTSPLLIVDDEVVSFGKPEHNIITELKNKNNEKNRN
ncbi:MAG: thioredoxin family protein [Bacteroidetes bacterium]|nr:thioredoxin family protein [Bacteroidota bacterium]MBU1578525.1 thioredoxin family protein [Bacteroidota bacterium]MBU2466715.1 thioredoxin family protein [Bacteroidota bacterium]